jgi:hypothetical protein
MGWLFSTKRREIMSKSRIMAMIALITFAFGMAAIDNAVAGEMKKKSWHGATYIVKWEQIEVGDEEGHVIAVYESKAIHFDDQTGEATPSQDFGVMDLNLKTGEGFGHGYGVGTDKDGDKTYRTWEGKSVGDHWEGTFEEVKGTGKFEGIKAKGTWKSYSVAPGQNYEIVEGEGNYPD